MLTSDTLARRVVAMLKLDEDTALLGRQAAVEADGGGAAGGGVTAEPIPDTQIIKVSYRHRDPEQAKRVADG